MSNCRICNKPLSDGELSLRRTWHFDCERCAVCHAELPNPDLIEKCLNGGTPPAHDVCWKNQLFADFKSKTLPLSLSHIQLLNEQILNFYPAVDPDTTDISTLYDALLKLQETTVNVSWALSLTKDKLRIRESQAYSHIVRQRDETKREQQFESESTKLAKQAHTERNRAEREDPALRRRRLALEGWLKLGLTQDQAEAMMKGKTQ